MARISGIDIPRNKRGVIALTYIYGIGRSRASKLLAESGVSEDKKVEEIMSNKLISTTPETTTDDAIKLMVENQIRHLAVMDDQKLVGVISMRDIFYSMNYLSNN